VLARLLVDVGRVVSAERLMEDIWGSSASADGTGALRTNIWELRKLLRTSAVGNGETAPTGAEVIVRRDDGYALVAARDQVDSSCFEELLSKGRAAAPTDPDRAVAHLEAALDLWRGPAFGDLAGELPLQVAGARLDQQRVAAEELRAQLLLDLGRHEQVAAELGAVARAHPERERLWAVLMTALYRSGRQGEALRNYQEARASLVETIGVEPGPALRQLEQAILRHDPGLDWRPGLAPPNGDQPRTGTTGAPASTTDEPSGGEGGVSTTDGPAAGGPTAVAAPTRDRPDRGGPMSVRAPTTDDPDAGGPAGGAGAPRHNLPRPLTGLVGRAAERDAVAEVLERCRLVSLVGPGGCGKTRLAIAVAEDLAPRFPGGVWFVDLAGASGEGSVGGVVAAALGREPGPGSPEDDETLLVLDNCEHLVSPVADYLARVLDGAPNLRVLVTSREELRVTGETVCRLAGLGLPSPHGDGPFLGSEAVELFVRRGAATLAGFAPGAGTLELIARICRRLDGLPLAIELAAPLVGTLPVREIAQRVEERCSLVTDTPRRGRARHQTLGAAIDWSFDLLESPVQELFVQLGVFAGSFTVPAAKAVVGGAASPTGARAVLDGLGALVRASLLERVASHDGVERYRMLEPVREQAVDRLEALADADELWARHAGSIVDFAAAADRGMRGPRASRWREHAEDELPNVRAALQWAMAHDEVEVALRILSSLRWFLARLAPTDELARWLDTCMAGAEELAAELRLSLLTTSGMVSVLQVDHDRAGRLGREAAAAARGLHDDHQLAIALISSASAALASGDLPDSRRHLDEAHELCARLGDRWGLGWVLAGRAMVSYTTGRTDDARRRMEEALDNFRAVGDLHSQVVPLGSLALYALDVDERELALDLASEAVRTVTVVEYDHARHAALSVFGLAELSAAHPVAARRLLLCGLRELQPEQDSAFLSLDLEALAFLAVAVGSFDVAARLLGLAQQRRLSHRVPTPKWDTIVASVVDVTRRGLGPERAEQALQQGRQMTLDDAVAIAEAGTTAFTEPKPAPR
jgi:predicted ATPase/DNA-binding SARP family transcriptional activator